MSEYIMSRKDLKEQLIRLGEKNFKTEFVYKRRCSGRTTHLAFKHIVSAMENEGNWVIIWDWHSDISVFNTIRYILSNLERGWKFKKDPLNNECYIKFNPYECNPNELI